MVLEQHDGYWKFVMLTEFQTKTGLLDLSTHQSVDVDAGWQWLCDYFDNQGSNFVSVREYGLLLVTLQEHGEFALDIDIADHIG